MKQHAFLPANSPNLCDGLNSTDLVVCIHDGHKAGVFPDGFSHLLRPHKSCIVYIQKGDLKALLFQFFQGMQNGMVFKRRGNNMLFASAHPQRSGGHNGLVIRLAASGGKRDLPRIGMEAGRDPAPGIFQRFLGLLSKGVEAGRVAVIFFHIGQHSIDSRLAHFGGCSIVCVNHNIPLGLSSVNMGVERYLSPVSGSRATMVFP